MLLSLNPFLLNSSLYFFKNNKRILNLFLVNRHVYIGKKKKWKKKRKQLWFISTKSKIAIFNRPIISHALNIREYFFKNVPYYHYMRFLSADLGLQTKNDLIVSDTYVKSITVPPFFAANFWTQIRYSNIFLNLSKLNNVNLKNIKIYKEDNLIYKINILCNFLIKFINKFKYNFDILLIKLKTYKFFLKKYNKKLQHNNLFYKIKLISKHKIKKYKFIYYKYNFFFNFILSSKKQNNFLFINEDKSNKLLLKRKWIYYNSKILFINYNKNVTFSLKNKSLNNIKNFYENYKKYFLIKKANINKNNIYLLQQSLLLNNNNDYLVSKQPDRNLWPFPFFNSIASEYLFFWKYLNRIYNSNVTISYLCSYNNVTQASYKKYTWFSKNKKNNILKKELLLLKLKNKYLFFNLYNNFFFKALSNINNNYLKKLYAINECDNFIYNIFGYVYIVNYFKVKDFDVLEQTQDFYNLQLSEEDLDVNSYKDFPFLFNNYLYLKNNNKFLFNLNYNIFKKFKYNLYLSKFIYFLLVYIKCILKLNNNFNSLNFKILFNFLKFINYVKIIFNLNSVLHLKSTYTFLNYSFILKYFRKNFYLV